MKKYKLIFFSLYLYYIGFSFWIFTMQSQQQQQQQQQQQHRPLMSFSNLHLCFPETANTASSKPKIKIIAKKNDVTSENTSEVVAANVPSSSPKPKLKIKITTKKQSQDPEHAPASVPVQAPTTDETPKQKIKIIIKKNQPQQTPATTTNTTTNTTTTYPRIDCDFAPPVSMIYNPRGDYTTPPPKCCRFFIDNRHCFLRSTDNACIDLHTKEVFGFWNCNVGKKCQLLPVDNDDNDATACIAVAVPIANVNHDDIKHEKLSSSAALALEMRKKSDANRARSSGQPVALLRKKIASQFGMYSFNSLGNRIQSTT
jgi:hypothetical protein